MLLGTITGLSTAIPFVILALFVLGVGNGTVIPIATGIVLRYLPMADAGVGGTILTTGQQLTGALGIVLTGEFLMGDGASLSSPATYVDGLALQVCALLRRLPQPYPHRHAESTVIIEFFYLPQILYHPIIDNKIQSR